MFINLRNRIETTSYVEDSVVDKNMHAYRSPRNSERIKCMYMGPVVWGRIGRIERFLLAYGVDYNAEESTVSEPNITNFELAKRGINNFELVGYNADILVCVGFIIGGLECR